MHPVFWCYTIIVRRYKRTNKAFTLIEIILVVAIISIIALIVISTTIIQSINNTNKASDLATINSLNLATKTFAIEKQTLTTDIFAGITTDTARLQALVDNNNISETVTPLEGGVSFVWNIQNQLWEISSETKTYDFASSSNTIDLFRHTGTWSQTTNGFLSNNGLLFVENKNDEYRISVNAKLSAGTSGGYGILFDTSLSSSDQDTGYALQFDRGTPVSGGGYGALIIRKRVNGYEFNPAVVASNADSPIIPVSPSSTWWSSEHNIELSVSKVTGQVGKKQLSVSIDGIKIDKLNYIFNSSVAAADDFTGIRSWGLYTTTYHNMTISPY